MIARRSLWMTNLVRSRFGAEVDPRCGRCDTGKVENMAYIILKIKLNSNINNTNSLGKLCKTCLDAKSEFLFLDYFYFVFSWNKLS